MAESLSLLDRTFRLLDAATQEPAEIAKGARVGTEWLKKLKARKIPDPSVRRIQRLHDYLLTALPDSFESNPKRRASGLVAANSGE